MSRTLLILALGLGVVGGYGSAIAHVAHRKHCGRGEWSHSRVPSMPAPAVSAPAPEKKAETPTIIYVQPPAQQPIYLMPPQAPPTAASAPEKPSPTQ
ncbi:MAG: hypothetical protein ACOZIN_16200 [Myxococcota bacterium]